MATTPDSQVSVARDGHVGVECEFDPNVPAAGSTQAVNVLQMAEVGEPLFDGYDNELLNIFSGGARPGHIDEDHWPVDARIELGVDTIGSPESGKHHHDHRQVGGDAMTRKNIDDRVRRDHSLCRPVNGLLLLRSLYHDPCQFITD